MLGTGLGGKLGYTPQQATDLFRSYMDGLIEAHGPEAGTVLKFATPQVRKALGNDYVKARWNGNYGHSGAGEDAQGGRAGSKGGIRDQTKKPGGSEPLIGPG